jgi:16S rRNA (guanine1207-N2)-methyltransferase
VPSAESQLALANAERIAQGRLLIVGFDADVAHALSPSAVFHQNWRAFRACSDIDNVSFGPWFSLDAAEQPFDTALVEMPRETERLRMVLSMAMSSLAPDGRIVLIGRNDSGIKSAKRHLVGHSEVMDFRFHARALQATVSDHPGTSTLDEWETTFTAHVAGRSFEVHQFPGVFARGHVDEGTQRLLEVLDMDVGARVLDVGCGNGMIGAWLAAGGVVCESCDVDALAVEAATRTAGPAFASDVYSDVSGTFDVIVTNPPFHAGVRQTSDVALRLIEEAPAHLNPGGSLWLVANRFLDYKSPLEAAFARVEVVSDDKKFRVFLGRR